MNAGGQKVQYYRLENLSTEWQTGLYNSTNNPFGKVIRCQDCHMSLYPFGGNSNYKVGDLNITSPTPAVFATNYAAVPGVATDGNAPLAAASSRHTLLHGYRCSAVVGTRAQRSTR